MMGFGKSGGAWGLRVRPDRCGRRWRRSLGKIHLCLGAKHPIDATITHLMMLLRSSVLLSACLYSYRVELVEGTRLLHSYTLTFVFRLLPAQSACRSHKHTAERVRWRDKEEGAPLIHAVNLPSDLSCTFLPFFAY